MDDEVDDVVDCEADRIPHTRKTCRNGAEWTITGSWSTAPPLHVCSQHLVGALRSWAKNAPATVARRG